MGHQITQDTDIIIFRSHIMGEENHNLCYFPPTYKWRNIIIDEHLYVSPLNRIVLLPYSIFAFASGSHGVYSLDDYQFLPFYFGSSQLDNSALEPKDIPELEVMSTHKNEFLFCAAIDYINQVCLPSLWNSFS